MGKKQPGARELMVSALFNDRKTVELPLSGYESQTLIWALEAYAEVFTEGKGAAPEGPEDVESDRKTVEQCEELTERIYLLWSP